ncbi:MAG: PepSY domain-containing protein [Halieaceae bacterium]
MNRSLFITIHMYLAAFFAPFVLLVCISGGLYLIGIKGSTETEAIYQSWDVEELRAELKDAPALNLSVAKLLGEAGVADYEFEYVKVKGDTLYTRPTSRQYYIIKLGDAVDISRATPSLQAAMMELHMGHGPTAFKTFQKFFAIGLLLVIGSGLWLGLSAPRLRTRTLAAAGGGSLAFLLVVLL